MPVKSIKKSGVDRVFGACLDCLQQWEGGQTALLAIRHHEATGHAVRVIQSIWWERHSAPAGQGNGKAPAKRPK